MGIINYINETKAEFKHVTWPTRSQAVLYTIFVIALSLVVAFLLGVFDTIFAAGLAKFLGQ
jgi:preprotein translocase SecE subunit